MSNSQSIRVKLKQSDKYRTVVTDTSPEDVPIIFSNDGFYKNLTGYDSKSPDLKKLINVLVCEPRKFTIPLRYNIVKDTETVRTLSLIHPHNQLRVVDFYNKYDQLICDYAGRSRFSIRYPKMVGTIFYIKSPVDDKNKYKKIGLDTIAIEKLVRNPASYFSYSGFEHLYKFFYSDDFLRLEKKFNFLLYLDISNCFDSIYTHSITWAVKNKTLAKENTRASGFGNDFDKLMQQMNYNETNGICVGSEFSRIFSELILSKVDQVVYQNLFVKKIYFQIDYVCKRYVDNYYIFANSKENLNLIKYEFTVALQEYKLHLNTTKTETQTRPFFTSKSLVVEKVNQSIQNLWEITTEQNNSACIPRPIRRYSSLFGKFTREVKAACYSSGLGYDAIANYVVSAMKRKLVELVNEIHKIEGSTKNGVKPSDFRQLLLLILDISFYFVTLHPTVASSRRLSHSIVLVAQNLKKHDKEGFEIAREYVQRWAKVLVKSPTFSSLFQKEDIVPIELLNIVVSLQEFSDDGSLESELLDVALPTTGNGKYFHIIVQLFVYKNHAELQARRSSVFELARKRLTSSTNLTKEAELTYLLLDLLSCPFIPNEDRAKLLLDVWPILKKEFSKIGKISSVKACQIVEEIEKQHWFVWWQGIDLLNLLNKKELSSVYA